MDLYLNHTQPAYKYQHTFEQQSQNANNTAFITNFIWIIILVFSLACCFVDSYLQQLEFNNKKCRERYLRKCKRFYHKHSYRLSKRRSFSKFCWINLFPGLPDYAIKAIGPRITIPHFYYLLKYFNDYKQQSHQFTHSFVFENHLFPGKNMMTKKFLNDSTSIGSIQSILDTATSVNASSFGLPAASTQFREALNNSLKVNVSLTGKQRKQLENEIDFPVVFKNTTSVVNDHPVIYGMRELVREIYDRIFDVSAAKLPTLVVGSSAREAKLYAGNSMVEHYFHLSESKDYDRCVKPFLERLVSRVTELRKKHQSKGQQSEKFVKQYTNLLNMYNDCLSLENKPSNIHTEFPNKEYQTLLFEDSFYNLHPNDYYDLFSSTNAEIGYGYGLLPYELIFPELPSNSLYTYHYDPLSHKSSITFNNGYCNGYTHRFSSWATLLTNPVMNFPTFSLVVEIVSRVGPFAIFKIMKVKRTGDEIVRRFELPEKKKFIKFLDLFSSVNNEGKIKHPNYISMYADEFFEVLNYNLSIDPKSLTVQNTMTFIRRRSGGVSLVSKELLAPWHLAPKNFYTAAVTIYLYSKIMLLTERKIELSSDFLSLQTNFQWIRGLLTKAAFCWLMPFEKIYRWLISEDYADKLILMMEDSIIQRHKVIVKNPQKLIYNIIIDEIEIDDLPECPVCYRLHKKLGDQLIKCQHKKHEVTLTMSDEDIKIIEAELIDTDSDPDGLAKIKTRARDAIPKGGFSVTTRMHYIEGGPGCGKSYIIQQMATPRDLIYAPFTKLMTDYRGLKDENDENYDLFFKTIHRGLESRGRATIYIDEFTALPLEYIKMVIYLNGAEDVFIVGDYKQTKVKEPDEGTYIGSVVDIDDLPKHTVLRNFRNPQDSVGLLNKHYKYKMQAMSKVEKSIYVYGPEDEKPSNLGTEMAFSHLSCHSHSLKEKSTVKCFQGSTFKHKDGGTLYIDKDMGTTAFNPDFLIVALSRHKFRLNIVHDGSPLAKTWLAQFNYDETKGYLGFPLNLESLVGYDGNEIKPNSEMKMPNEKLDSFLSTTSEFTSDQTKPLINMFRSKHIHITKTRLIIILLSLLKLYLGKSLSDYHLISGTLYYFSMYLKVQFLSRLFRFHKVSWKKYFLKMALSQILAMSITSFITFYWPILKWSFPFISTLYPSPPEYFCQLIEPWPVFGLLSWYVNYYCADDVDLYTIKYNTQRFKTFEFRQLVNGDDRLGKYSQLFKDYFYWFNFGKYTDSLFIPDSPKEPEEPINKLQTGYDEYQLLGENLKPIATINNEQVSLNQLGSSEVDAEFKSGEMSTEILNPVNQKGHVKSLKDKYYRFCSGVGYHFSRKQPMQELQVMANRYLNKKKKPPTGLCDNMEQMARKMVDEFMKEHVDLDEIKYTEDEINMISNEFLNSANSKKYENQLKGDDNPDVGTIRFHLKKIFKPSLVKDIAPEKAGQGISAWNKDLQIIFGICSRIINKTLLDVLKSHVVYDNRMTTEQMKEKLSTLMASMSQSSVNGITDYTMYDSQQDDFTQCIEKEFLRRLKISDEYIDIYYRYRKNYKIISDNIYGKCGTEKTSGEPATLLMNSIIAMVITNYIFRGEGPSVMAAKGDDGFKKQVNLHLDEARIYELKQFTNLTIKAYVGNEAEFCGFVISENQFIESIPRKLNKLAAHGFRDYEHFCEYQTGLRDWVEQQEKSDLQMIIAANTVLYGLTYAESFSMFSTIKSFSKINEDQFRATFKLFTETPVFKTAKDGQHLLEV